MTTSGTQTFNPDLGALTIYAFQLCGLRPTSLLQEHFVTARMATNMMLGRWSSDGVQLWQVDTQTVPLVQGTSTYAVPTNTIVILDAYITVTSGSSVSNRIITPISRTEYASYANPNQQGFPTVFWFDRLLTAPTVSLWPVPDGNETSLVYYRVRQIDDANFTNGQTVDIPYYYMEALAYGLAYRLAAIWAVDKAQGLKALADESYKMAIAQNLETSNFFLSPMVSGYYKP